MTKGAVGETLQKIQKKERQAATKRRQETDKKKRQDNWWGLHRVKMLKYPLERSKNPQNATG